MPPISPSSSGSISRQAPSAFNLAAIALLLALIGLGFAYLLAAAARRDQTIIASTWSKPVVHKNLAGAQLTIPASWMRRPLGRDGDIVEQVDLKVNLRFAPGAQPFPVKLRLVALAKGQPSSYLLDAVYVRQFSSLQEQGAPGLVGKPLKPVEGFQNETVWYDPLSPNPFVAKCLSENANGSKASCLRTVQLTSKLALVYRFDADLLIYWKNFDATVRPILLQIGVFTRRYTKESNP